MKKIVFLSIALITAVFLAAPAQNNVTISEQLKAQNTRFEYSDFEKLKLPIIKKQNAGIWMPDTVYGINNNWEGEIIIRRNIFDYRYSAQILTTVSIEQGQGNNS